MENSNKVEPKDETNDIMNQFLEFIFSKAYAYGYIVCLSNYMYRECIKYAEKINFSKDQIYNINNKKNYDELITYAVNSYNKFSYLPGVTFVVELSFQQFDTVRYIESYYKKLKEKINFSDVFEELKFEGLFLNKKLVLGYDDGNGPLGNWEKYVDTFISGYDYSNYRISNHRHFPNGLKKNNITKDDINNSIYLFKTVVKSDNIYFPKDLLSDNSRLIRKMTYSTIYNLFVTEYKMMYKYHHEEVSRSEFYKSLAYLRLKDIVKLIIKNLDVVPDEYVYSQILYSMLAMENANILEFYDNGQAFGYDDDDIYCYIKPTAASLFTTKYDNLGISTMIQQMDYYVHRTNLTNFQLLQELIKKCFDEKKIDYDDNLVNNIISDGYYDKDEIRLSWISKIQLIDTLSLDLAMLQTLNDYNIIEKDENLEQSFDDELWKNAYDILSFSACMNELLDNNDKTKKKSKKL